MTDVYTIVCNEHTLPYCIKKEEEKRWPVHVDTLVEYSSLSCELIQAKGHLEDLWMESYAYDEESGEVFPPTRLELEWEHTCESLSRAKRAFEVWMLPPPVVQGISRLTWIAVQAEEDQAQYLRELEEDFGEVIDIIKKETQRNTWAGLWGEKELTDRDVDSGFIYSWLFNKEKR